MKSAGIRTNIAVSTLAALTVALAPLGHAGELVRVNPDGSVTRTQIDGPAPGTNLAPLASTAQLQAPPPGSTATAIPKSGLPKGALTAGGSCYAAYPSYYPACPPGYPAYPTGYPAYPTGYPAYPGGYPLYPSVPGTTPYTIPAPGYSMPIGQPTAPFNGPAFTQPTITSAGGTVTYGYYNPPLYPPAYPAYPGQYPAYPGYSCPPAAPVYNYPAAPLPCPTYPYTTYPSTFSYGTSTSLGNFTYRNGGLSVTFGGSQVRSNIKSSTRTFGGSVGGSVRSSASYSGSTRPFGRR